MKRLLIFTFSFCFSINFIYADINLDLILAARSGNYDQAVSLLKNGADVNAKDVEGWSPLHWAAFVGDVRIARLLLDKGGNPELRNFSGNTPLDLAQFNNKQEMVNLLTVVDVDNFIPAGKNLFGTNILVVIIGNKDYQNNIPIVEFAQNDAEIFQKYMVITFGIPEVNIWMNKNVTLGNLSALFGTKETYKQSKLYRELIIRKKDIILYYSGHGAPGINNNKGYLVPVDADVMSIEITGYAIDTLFDNLKKMKQDGCIGKTWIIIDSCFSGGSGGGRLIKDISPVTVEVENPLASAKDAIMMFSSSGKEVSSWYRRNRHGLFTYFLLKGISGGAGSSKDGTITVKGLKDYLNDMVPRYAINQTSQEQHPQIIVNDENMPILKLK